MGQIENNYEKQHSDIEINITTNGSGTGAAAAINGTADIGMLSRDLSDSEKSSGLVATVIGKDGIAVTINSSVTGVTSLTLDQIAQIYEGKITNWKDVGGNDQNIVLLGRESSSGTRGAFEEILGNIGKDVSTTMQEYSSTSALFTAVKNTAGAIGYVSLGYVVEDKDTSYFAVKVAGVDATVDNVVNGTYTLQRNLILATKGAPSGASADLINYVLSSEGQKVVEDLGYIPIA